jgi:hypothetical protein
MAVKRQKHEEEIDADAHVTDAPTLGSGIETHEEEGTSGTVAGEGKGHTQTPIEVRKPINAQPESSATPPVKIIARGDGEGMTTTISEVGKSRDESLTEMREQASAPSEQPARAPAKATENEQREGDANNGEPYEQASTAQEQPSTTTKPSTALPVKDVRYKSLFQTKPVAGKGDEMEDLADTAPTEASVHRPTRALYIRNFMRPLQPSTLRKHLVKVATPSTSEPDEGVVEIFHLDQVRTHAFVLFKTMEAATRTRNALHGRVFPAERDRKQLWADFIPEDKVQQWIDAELNDDGGGRTNGRRWEVQYNTSSDGAVDVVLSELLADGRTAPARRESQPAVKGIPGAPTGPRVQVRSNSGAFDAAPPLGRTSLEGEGASSKPSSTGAGSAPVTARGPNTDVAFQKMGSLVSVYSTSAQLGHRIMRELPFKFAEEFWRCLV